MSPVFSLSRARVGPRGGSEGSTVAQRVSASNISRSGFSPTGRAKARPTLNKIALALIIILAAACGRRATIVHAAPHTVGDEISFTSLESPSLQFLPRQQEAAGWKLEEDPIVIPGDHLGSYLDSDAAHFARYALLDLTVGKYSAIDGGGFATVEIYRFPDFVKAFGAYSMRKQGNLQVLDLQNESFQNAHAIQIWRGAFYIRVIGDPPASILKLAGSVADKMPAAPGKPAVFAFLPDQNRVPHSERYSAESGLGQPYLANSFQATFNINNDEIEGLVIPAADKNAAAAVLNAYRALFVRNGKLLDPIPNLGEDNFTAEDKFLGRAVAFRIDRFVVVFNGYQERQHLIDLATLADQRILGTIRKQLVTADNQNQ
jgi:uncharacterized protein DUF6599